MCYDKNNKNCINAVATTTTATAAAASAAISSSSRKSISDSFVVVGSRIDKTSIESQQQGQRLSSYASSQKHSPRTPKKSSIIFSGSSSIGVENNICSKATTTDSKDNSSNIHNQHYHNHNYVSPNHSSYSSINVQQKQQFHDSGSIAQQTDCVFKCTCPTTSATNYNSIKTGSGSSSNNGPKNNNEKKNNFIDINQMKFSKNICCDAATSPGRISNCQRSPKVNKIFNNFNSISNDIESHHYHHQQNNKNEKLHDISTNKSSISSPRRLVTTRNAATSPHLDLRKLNTNNRNNQKNNESLKTPELNNHRIQLEKSNSLGESKPLRQLRTTRSLSPRPPVRHQHAIMVSDENDIVSVKISPNEDYMMDTMNDSIKVMKLCKAQPNSTIAMSKKKQQKVSKSEHNSPNLCADNDSVFIYDKSGMNNKSTGCLVYIPSDPWLKMSDVQNDKSKCDTSYGGSDSGTFTINKRNVKGGKNHKFLTKESRSLSRNDLDPISFNDPWIWRKTNQQKQQRLQQQPENFMKKSSNNITRSPKHDDFRQTKSFSITKFDISSDSTKSRPKLQRSKSPNKIINDDDNLLTPTSPSSPFLIAPDSHYTTAYIFPSTATVFNENHLDSICSNKNLPSSSPCKDNILRGDKQQFSQQSSNQLNKSLLNVVNPNLIQARHSFSSGSQKDDELQLNIRRLSEQIKHNQISSTANIYSGRNNSGGADFSDYLKQFRNSEAKKAAEAIAATALGNSDSSSVTKSPRNSSSSKNIDAVLETTC